MGPRRRPHDCCGARAPCSGTVSHTPIQHMPAARQPPQAAPSAAPAPDQVRQELAKVLASQTFATSARLRRFLSYVVEETLANRADAIKELVLGTEVFDRPADFDPRIDTIVRVEAVKLRKRLDEYYRTEGSADTVRIDIPKGSYVPRFAPREWAAAPVSSRPVRRRALYGAALVLALGGAALALWLVRVNRSEGAAPVASVAVLPFLNLSSDTANEYFSDGLTEELTHVLAGVHSLRVASRTSAFSFKGKQADARDIGAKLNVASIVEGSVRKEGDRFKITAQLIRTGDGYHLWSDVYERDVKDVFAVQSEIADAIASVLEVKLTPDASRRLTKERTASVRAFDLYLRGLSAMAKDPTGTAGEAERLLREAIATDPSYSRPHVALARLYLFGNVFSTRATRDVVAGATQAAADALALDAEDAEAHAVRGSLAARHEYDWEAAERHLRHALELDPYSAWAHNTLAQDVLAPQGRWQEAVEENRRAIELDPVSPWFAGGARFLLYLQRQCDAVLDQVGPRAGGMVAGCLHMKGDHARALTLVEQPGALGPPPYTLSMLGRVQADAGLTAEARQTLARLEQLFEGQFASPFLKSIVHIGLREHDQAFAGLEAARQEQDSSLIFVRVSYLFDPLRADPRFGTLLARIGLSDEQVERRQSVAARANR